MSWGVKSIWAQLCRKNRRSANGLLSARRQSLTICRKGGALAHRTLGVLVAVPLPTAKVSPSWPVRRSSASESISAMVALWGRRVVKSTNQILPSRRVGGLTVSVISAARHSRAWLGIAVAVAAGAAFAIANTSAGVAYQGGTNPLTAASFTNCGRLPMMVRTCIRV